MDRYPGCHTRITRSFDKVIGSIERITEVWVIVHISESIVTGQECDTWGRDLLVGIEIPVIVVDIIRSEVEDITLIEGKWEDRARESSIGSDLISILVEYDISLWIGTSEHRENLILMTQYLCRYTSYTSDYFSGTLEFPCSLTCRFYTRISESRSDEFSIGWLEYLSIDLEVFCRILYPEHSQRKYIPSTSSIGEWIGSIFFYGCPCHVFERERGGDHI